MKKMQLHHRAAKVFCAASLALLLTACGSTKINVNDYLTTEVAGYDGNGSAGWNVDLGQLVTDNHEAFGLKEGYSIMEYQAVLQKFHDNVKGDFDKSTELSNGETVTFSLDPSSFSAIENEYDVKFEMRDVDLTVSGLQEIVELNPFDKIKMQYSGTAPHAFAMVDNSALSDLNLPRSIQFDITPQDDLNVGDRVKVTLQEGTYESCLAEGYRLTETEREYTVEAVDAYLWSLDDLPTNASEKMEKNGRDMIAAEIASSWNDPSDLDSISMRGNYLLTAKDDIIPIEYNSLVYVYEVKTKDFSYYSYVQYPDVMLLADGTCSFNLTTARKAEGGYGLGILYGAAFKHNGLYYVGYADLDSLFNAVVTQQIDMYEYQSTVS